MKEEDIIASGDTRVGDSAWRISFALLGCVFFSYCFSVVSFYLGLTVSRFVFPLATIAGLLLGAFVVGFRTKCRSYGWIVAVLAVMAVSILGAGLIYDHSYDGIRYHQEIVGALLSGWNPLSGDAETYDLGLWVLHYAKAVEISEAALSCFTGRIETGKAVNIIAAASVAFGVYAFLRDARGTVFLKDCDMPSLGRRRSIWLTLAVMANPVLVSQLPTFYIDFYKYLYLILILLAFYLVTSREGCRRTSGYILLGMSLVLAMGTKFNMFAEAALWMVLAFIWLCSVRDFVALKRIFLVSVCALVAGVILAWHPYITNLTGWGHPLYPLMGDAPVDIMGYNTPEMYEGSGRIFNFFKSLTAVSFPVYDQRAGGFTVLMPLILVLCAASGVVMRKKLKGLVWYIEGCVLLTCFLYEQSWWARYNCQLWLVGAVFLVASQYSVPSRKTGVAISVLMVLAGAATAATSLATEVKRGSYLRYLFDACREEQVTVSGEFPVHIRRHFDEEGIDYIVSDTVPDRPGYQTLYYYIDCEPLISLPTGRIEKIDARLSRWHETVDRYRYPSTATDEQ